MLFPRDFYEAFTARLLATCERRNDMSRAKMACKCVSSVVTVRTSTHNPIRPYIMRDPAEIINKLVADIKKRPRDQTLRDIALASDVPELWLAKLVRGALKHPSFCNICKLYCSFYNVTTIEF